jgi:hypothetical protein
MKQLFREITIFFSPIYYLWLVQRGHRGHRTRGGVVPRAPAPARRGARAWAWPGCAGAQGVEVERAFGRLLAMVRRCGAASWRRAASESMQRAHLINV